jgi:hypothetical protein
MPRLVVSYALLATVFVLLHCFVVASWIDVKAAGPNAFPGSPDWRGIYFRWLESYIWMNGALVGVSLGGVSLFIASARLSTAPTYSGVFRLLRIAGFVLPAAALVAGMQVEESVMVPERPIEVERCERLCHAEQLNAP